MTLQKGFETDIDNKKNKKAENKSFETIAPEKDNHTRREFEIGKLGNQEICQVPKYRSNFPLRLLPKSVLSAIGQMSKFVVAYSLCILFNYI